MVVTDVLPVGTTFVSATPSQGTCSGTTTVVCSLGTILSGGGATISLTVRIDAEGSIANTASVTSVTTDPTPENGSSTATLSAALASAIPTLSEWVLLLFALGLAVVAIRRMH